MADELKKALLERNIQCISEYNGKFVLLNTVAPVGNIPLPFKPLFSREIPVGSIFITKVDSATENETKTSVFVCCNASQASRSFESETPQYKIVFASYNVKAAKVTFVEKVLS